MIQEGAGVFRGGCWGSGGGGRVALIVSCACLEKHMGGEVDWLGGSREGW